MVEIVIREAVPEDAAGIAWVNIRTWQTAYAGLFPEDQLKKLDGNFERMAENWGRRIADQETPLALYVAEDDGEVIGFAGGEAERSGDWSFEGELSVIYILDRYQKQGIGRKLVKAVSQTLLDQGMHSMIVWVLKDSPYRGFYEALGGVYVGEQDHEVWGEKYQVLGYGWEQLEDLSGK